MISNIIHDISHQKNWTKFCGEIEHMQYGTGNVVRTVQVRIYM